MLGLGYWQWPHPSLSNWLQDISTVSQSLVRLESNLKDQPILIHHLQSQNKYFTLVVNKGEKEFPLQLKHKKKQKGAIIFQLKNSSWENGAGILAPEEVMILEWKN